MKFLIFPIIAFCSALALTPVANADMSVHVGPGGFGVSVGHIYPPPPPPPPGFGPRYRPHHHGYLPPPPPPRFRHMPPPPPPRHHMRGPYRGHYRW